MIRSRDLALRAVLADAPVNTSCAAFEAVMLVRAGTRPADPIRGASVRPSTLSRQVEPHTPGVLAELDTRAAAERLRSVVSLIVPQTAVESRYRGCRHRYEVHRVSVPVHLEPLVRTTLHRAGRAGSVQLESGRPTGAAERQAHRQRSLAVAAWRAALLAAGPGRGADRLVVRIGDPDTSRVLVRAAAVLGVPVRAALRPGGHLLSVVGQPAVDHLLAEVTGESARPVSFAHDSLAG